jgi:pimeloyl-ACP methyl ester carboxylesterase
MIIGEIEVFMFIKHNNAQLYTVEFGTGSHTILAHGGWTGSWELWAEPFTHLSKSWRTVAYDHRGTGATLAPVESISVGNLVDDLFAVMDKIKIEKCVLAAESAGGIIALTAALQQPQRFEGLVLVDVLTHNEKPESDLPFINGLKSNYEQTVGNFVDSCVPDTEPNNVEIRAWGRKIILRASSESAVRLLEITHGVDLRPQAAQINIPTLIIHGDLDALVPLSDSEWLASQMPNSQLHIIKGAGHVPTVTRGREIAEYIDQFL